ncbi:hypothetical protein [Aliarcobacter butzleri]|uniref:hypothetical protein n=1 Tax=Aliarcobacter butzleri TaxID=28197 RepID=UPI00126A2837|nr:hypothetical protein [Aliarcobacter butzleri]
MTKNIFKQKLQLVNIDYFDFCIRHEINPVALNKLNGKDFVPEDVEDKVNNYVAFLKEEEASFLDKAIASGLRVVKDRVQIPLNDKKNFDIEINSSMLSKIDFI